MQSRGPLALENPLRFSTEVTNATVFCFEERVVNPKTGSSCALKITIHPLHHKKAWKISPLDGRLDWERSSGGRIQSQLERSGGTTGGRKTHPVGLLPSGASADSADEVNQVKA